MSAAVKPPRVDWSEVVDRAAGIVASYSTGVTLRQLFYRLVAAEVLPNTTSAYKTLSSRTAEARREDGFPSLVDRTRAIHQLWFSENPTEALEDMASRYRLDRTEGQELAIYIGVEKSGIVNQDDDVVVGRADPAHDVIRPLHLLFGGRELDRQRELDTSHRLRRSRRQRLRGHLGRPADPVVVDAASDDRREVVVNLDVPARDRPLDVHAGEVVLLVVVAGALGLLRLGRRRELGERGLVGRAAGQDDANRYCVEDRVNWPLG